MGEIPEFSEKNIPKGELRKVHKEECSEPCISMQEQFHEQIQYMLSLEVPFENCYWVLPHKVLAGEYPGDDHFFIAQKKLNALLNAGVEVFINLIEPYEEESEDDDVIPYAEMLAMFAKQRNKEISCLRFSICDMHSPSVEQLQEIIKVIVLCIEQKRKVYIHCKAGLGRTGVIVGALLIYLQYAVPENFVEIIQELRKNMGRTFRSPSTNDQIDFVKSIFSNDKLPLVLDD